MQNAHKPSESTVPRVEVVAKPQAPIPNMTSLVALASSEDQAQRILDRLRNEVHLEGPGVSLLRPRPGGEQDYEQVEELLTHSTFSHGEKVHALSGGVIGALVGAGVMWISALQLGGPAALCVIASFMGIHAGNAIGAIVGLGFRDADVEKYRTRINNGAFFLAVESEDDAKIAKARAILETEGAEDILVEPRAKLQDPEERESGHSHV